MQLNEIQNALLVAKVVKRRQFRQLTPEQAKVNHDATVAMLNIASQRADKATRS